jgi:hypothetical protein
MITLSPPSIAAASRQACGGLRRKEGREQVQSGWRPCHVEGAGFEPGHETAANRAAADTVFSRPIDARNSSREDYRIMVEGFSRTRSRRLSRLPSRTPAESTLLLAPACFPPASPECALETGKQRRIPRTLSKQLIYSKKSGAGEGIRTLDPNLGKTPVAWKHRYRVRKRVAARQLRADRATTV